MYRGRLWTMRQYAGFGTAEETNQRYRYLLEQGQTGLSVAFDLPTQMGYDSDHPLARGRGRQGRRLPSPPSTTWRRCSTGIPLDRVSTSMTINATAADPARAVRRGRRRSRASRASALRGTVQNDILKEYIARGTYIYPPRAVAAAHHRHLRLLRGERARSGTPSPSPATTSARPAATAAQEVAFTLADGIAYVEAARRRAGSTSTTSPRSSPSSSTPTTTCSRRWRSSAPRAGCGRASCASASARRDPRSLRAALPHPDRRLHADRRSSRTTTSCASPCRRWPPCSAARSRCTPTRCDEALACRPRRRRARAAHAAGARLRVRRGRHRRSAGRLLCGRGADPPDRGGGRDATSPRSTGWAARSAPSRFLQREIQESAYRYQQEIEAKARIVVGVNEFVMDEPAPGDLFKGDPNVGRALAERLGRFTRRVTPRPRRGRSERSSGPRAAATTSSP